MVEYRPKPLANLLLNKKRMIRSFFLPFYLGFVNLGFSKDSSFGKEKKRVGIRVYSFGVSILFEWIRHTS